MAETWRLAGCKGRRLRRRCQQGWLRRDLFWPLPAPGNSRPPSVLPCCRGIAPVSPCLPVCACACACARVCACVCVCAIFSFLPRPPATTSSHLDCIYRDPISDQPHMGTGEDMDVACWGLNWLSVLSTGLCPHSDDEVGARTSPRGRAPRHRLTLPK